MIALWMARQSSSRGPVAATMSRGTAPVWCQTAAMSFDLAVWEGPRPATDEDAAEVHEQLMERLESDWSAPPTPAIVSYVAALTARWPDIDAPGGEDSPWSVGPLISDAAGG